MFLAPKFLFDTRKARFDHSTYLKLRTSPRLRPEFLLWQLLVPTKEAEPRCIQVERANLAVLATEMSP